ncbi:MAG: tRNA pseudouridine(55) synthase TruB [Bacteroidales bacterium]|nr:tRNA pseudouridine(55) synthase TruB [Bacteroidales bacterium]
MNGWLIIDKPAGITSRDVVNRVQRTLPRRTKIGHTGTLDPLATGVLVLCVGAATKLADRVQAMGKVYESQFRLGAVSDTDDADGTVTHMEGIVPPSQDAISSALQQFLGIIEQRPPAFSALKVEGRRAHALARSGQAVELTPRSVRVDSVELLGYEWPFLAVRIACGKGTYIRSIARDLGGILGVGGLVATLRRTRVGPFTVERAVSPELDPQSVRQHLLPMSAMEWTEPSFHDTNHAHCTRTIPLTEE